MAISPVAALSRAFVTWSKTPDRAATAWGSDAAVLGELTTVSNLQFRTNTASANARIWWQVVEFPNAADVNVQKGSTSMTGTSLSRTVTLPIAVDPARTFVLVGFRSGGSGADVGARLLRARLTNATTIVIDRSISGSPDDITQIVWQAVELKDGSQVQHGTAAFAAGVDSASAALSVVDPARAVAFASVQGGGGQEMGRSGYSADDLPGVGQATLEAASPTQLTLTRASTAAAADVAWFVVEFPGGPASYREQVLADDPAGYWRLGEASGAVATDQRGANNGAYVNGPALGTAGVLARDPDSAVGFDGGSQYAEVPHASALNPIQFTVEAWARPTGGQGVYRAVVASWPNFGTGGAGGYGIWASSSDQWEAWLHDDYSGPMVAAGAVTPNQWVHLVQTFDGVTLRLYIDGSLAAATPTTYYAPNVLVPLGIGAYDPGGGYLDHFPGQIDEVAVYDTALSAARVRRHYDAASF